MKILFVSDYYPNPIQPQFCIFIQQQAQALIALGHQVEVIVPYSTYGLKEKIQNKVLEGVTVYYSEYYTLYKKIYSRLALIRNIRIFEKYFDFDQYDVISIHMFDEFTLRMFTSIAKKHKNKLVIHYHGLSVLYDKKLPLVIRILQKRGDTELKKLVAKADAIVGVSNKVCERVRAIFPNARTYTVYNGVNTDLFQPCVTREDKEFKIISVASLKKIKGNHYLIDAVRLLSDQYKDQQIKLIIVGHGPEKDNLIAQIKKLHMENSIHLVGYIAYDEVIRIMSQCDVFVMPSFYEALGCAYLEAMACNIPVIGCRYQGIDEIIADKDNGFLVEPHNIIQIYEKLDYILQYPEKAKEIAYKGYQTVIKHYTWLDSAKSLLELYHQL